MGNLYCNDILSSSNIVCVNWISYLGMLKIAVQNFYLCQHSVSYNSLEIIISVVHLLDGDSNPVVELHYDVGTTIEMVCRVRRPPLSHATVLWEVSPAHKRHLRLTDVNNTTSVVSNVIVLNRDVSRGGIKIDTGRNISTGNLISRLISRTLLSHFHNFQTYYNTGPMLVI